MKIWKMTTLYFLISTLLGGLCYAAPQEGVQPQASVASPQVDLKRTMGFQEWKKNQVFDARVNLDKFKSPQLSRSENSAQSQDQEVSAVDKSGENTNNPPGVEAVTTNAEAEKLRQLEFNLEIAQGLTVHDYFALYLKNKSKQEMARATQQLSPEELSELLMAYRKSLYGLPIPEVKTETATNKNL